MTPYYLMNYFHVCVSQDPFVLSIRLVALNFTPHNCASIAYLKSRFPVKAHSVNGIRRGKYADR